MVFNFYYFKKNSVALSMETSGLQKRSIALGIPVREDF